MIINLIPDLGQTKGIIDIYNPPANFITQDAQMIIAGGICFFLMLWGFSKLIKVLKR